MRLGIRWKLILGIGAPLACLLAVSLAVSFREQRDEAMRRMEAYLSKESQYYAARLDTQFQTLAQIARSMAAFLDSHGDVKEAELYEMLRRNVGQSPLIYGSCVAFEPYTFEPSRRLFAPYVYKGTGKEEEGRGPDGLLRMDVADAYDYMDPKWEWFHGPRTTGDAMWTEPFFDEGAGNVIMCTYVAPFFKDGKFRGTVNIDVKLEDLQDFAGRMRTGAADVVILSRKRVVVSGPPLVAIMHDTSDSLAEKFSRPDLAALGRRMSAGGVATERFASLDPTPRAALISYGPIRSTGWSFAAMVDEGTVMAPVYRELGNRATAAGVVVAVVVTVILGIGVWLTRPIERLAGAVAEVGRRGLDAPAVPEGGKDEIGDLSRAFNTMLGHLRGQVNALTEATRQRESVESELRIAREIQRSLLPRELPNGQHGFELDAFNGAARKVAGDFYDYFYLPDGRLSLVIADVCGKGVPAAMFMAVARTVVRNLAMNGRSPGQLLSEANRVLLSDNSQGLFVTVIVAFYDAASGRVAYANGGHPRPYVVSPDGRVRPFGVVTGTVVGALGDQEWTEQEERLEVGDEVVMYTDGVTDARRPGGPMFGERRLVELLRERPQASARETCQLIVARVDEFATRDWPDDVTLLALRRKGP